MVEHEMNIFLLIQQLRKVKAALAVVINNDKKLIDEAENLFLKSSTIYVDEDAQIQFEQSKDDFTKFLDGDIREKKRKSMGSMDKIYSNNV